jgi:exodeoxyribonuclease VII small subunit
MKEITFTPLDELNYEEALQELEELLERLETSEAELEHTLLYFERGQALAGHCLSLLDEAELKVKKIVEDQEVDIS